MALSLVAKSQVTRFCRQYWQLEPVLDYPEASLLRQENVQEEIHRSLFAVESAVAGQKAPPRYQTAILKSLVQKIQESIVDWDKHDISNNLLDVLSRRMAAPIVNEWTSVQHKCYVTYHQSLLDSRFTCQEPRIVLLEHRSLISAAGMTGLRTWEASLHLGQYLCANPWLVANKRILELGAGTGYLSILCAKHLNAAHVIASDGSDNIVNKLADNLFLNDLQGSPRIQPKNLKWGDALVGTEEPLWNGGRPVDFILGADITYDNAIISPLVSTLDEVVALFPGVVILIAATERNKATLDIFLDRCTRYNFTTDKVSFLVPRRDEQNGPFYDSSVPIHIYQVTKRCP